MLSSRLLKLDPLTGERRKNFLERLSDLFYRPIERIYMGMLGFLFREGRWHRRPAREPVVGRAGSRSCSIGAG